jgi:outer membrane protein assembly factor BamB
LLSCIGLLCLCESGMPHARAATAASVQAKAAPPQVTYQPKDTPQATWQANVERWRAEPGATGGDQYESAAELARRMMALARALLDSPEKGPSASPALYRAIATDFASLGGEAAGRMYLRRLVEAFPGHVGLTVEALDLGLSKITEDRLRDAPELDSWVEYASSRLAALARAGYLADTHPAVERAWKLRLALRMFERRYWDAAQVMAVLRATSGETAWWKHAWADLLIASGRSEDALRTLQELAAAKPTADSSVTSRIKILSKMPDVAPDFPRDLGLEMKWIAVRSRTGGADTSAIQTLLADSAEGQGLMLGEGALRASVWVLLDRILSAQKSETLAPLRRSQARDSEEPLQRAREADPQALVALCRRFPWSAAVHEAVLAGAEQWLRQGRSGLALRAFEDVLAHAEDADARGRAQVGVWLALASQVGDRESLLAALGTAGPDVPLPWMGGRQPASAIRQRLLDGLGPAAASPASPAAAVRLLRTPAAAPWGLGAFYRAPPDLLRAFPSPLGSVQSIGQYMLVAGPNLIACYGADPARPLWCRTLQSVDRPGHRLREVENRGGGRVNLAPVPGPFEPAIAEGRVVSRWGLDPSGQYLRGMAAFEASSGRTLWTTDENPDWQNVLPVSDPALADGRAYVLTMQDRIGPMMPIDLVCLDAARGTVLWDRPLGSQNFSIGRSERVRTDAPLEPVHYGNAVTVHRGSVYAVTNMGFVVRCDARDGMIEWVREYQRVSSTAVSSGAFRRQGAPPAVAGRLLVCMPRDYQGMFALNAATGRQAWDAPLVPAEEAVGLCGGAMIVQGLGHVLAIDAATGCVRWDRDFGERLLARSATAGQAVYVATSAGLVRLDAATGILLDRKAWDAAGPLRAMAVRGAEVVGVSEASPGAPAATGDPSPMASQDDLALPLSEAWRLDRPAPDLWIPPVAAAKTAREGEAKAPGRMLLVSRGLIECIEIGPQPRSRWQRFASSGLDDVLWTEKAVILAAGRNLACIAGDTGAPRWQADLPFTPAFRKVCPPYVVALADSADLPQAQDAAVIDLETGRLLWRRVLGDGRTSLRAMDVFADGGVLRFFGDASIAGRSQAADVEVRAADGQTLAVRPFAPGDAGPLLGIERAGMLVYGVTAPGVLWERPLSDGLTARRLAEIKDPGPRSPVVLRVTGPWIQVQESGGRFGGAAPQWVFCRADPAYVLRTDRQGEVIGDRLYLPAARGCTAVDLKTRQEVSYEVPVGTNAASLREVLSFHAARDRMWMASSLVAGRDGGVGGLQFDVFDSSTGAHRETQVLGRIQPGYVRRSARAAAARERLRGEQDELAGAVTQLVWTDTAVYLTDGRSLMALSASGTDSAGVTRLVPVASGPVTVDGLLDEWEGADFVALTGDGGRQGRLYLQHDADWLYMAVRYATGGFRPLVGGLDTGGGDRLEIGLSAGPFSYRWSVGADARGRPVWEPLADTGVPKNVSAAVRYDPAARELAYEVAIPWVEAGTSSYNKEPKRLGLSVGVWDDPPGGTGPARVLAWGGGLAGRRGAPAANNPIYMHTLREGAMDAMRTILDQAPDLPEAFDYFMASAELRSASTRDLIAVFADFVHRHPRSITVERLLAMDSRVRVRDGLDPSAALLDIAAKAGVPDAVCRRYARETQAYLSQWVNLAEGVQPRGIMIELSDGLSAAPSSWDHRVMWNKPWFPHAKPGYLSPQRLPQGEWCEIRLPLSFVNMNGHPICGISFGQQGELPIVWGRTAVVSDGKEEVLLSDGVPAGAAASGTWEWVDKPVAGGAKVHRGDTPPARYDTCYHAIERMPRPATAHLAPPEPPYLSQWVYLDPKDPPKTISVGLGDGRAWPLHAIWGAMTRYGRYMGPLPDTGRWQELRVPLAGTAVAAEPIGGMAFGHDGGRVWWDRTAIVTPAGEHVILDDSLPAAPAETPPGWLPWADGYVGRAEPAPGKAGTGILCDGHTGYIEAVDAALLDPPEMTIEAWVNLKNSGWSQDTRRWIVNKNMNESVDGHYALVVNRNMAGALLNIGGGEPNKFEVWSAEPFTWGDWHHLAMTFDSKNLKVYVDGRQAGSTEVNRNRGPCVANTPLQIARRQDGYSYLSGTLDEIRMYNRALSAQEVRARHEAGGAPVSDGAAAAQVAYWGFDDDAMPKNAALAWQWVEQPAKSGKCSHTDAVTGRYGGHVCLLKEPVIVHLPFDRQGAMTVLKENVPRLGPSEEAWRFFGRMCQLEPTLQGRIGLGRWFLKAAPDHPEALEVLRTLLLGYREINPKEAAAKVEEVISETSLPNQVVYAYRRKYAGQPRSYLAEWQVIGPFAAADKHNHRTAFPPETEPFSADAAYDGAAGKVRWKTIRAEPGEIDLLPLFEPNEQVAAYAVCWAHSERPQPAVIELVQDDTAMLWLNRKLVIDSVSRTGYRSYQNSATVQLEAGWNEILVKTSNTERNWRIVVELVGVTGLGLPPGVTVTASPPDAKQEAPAPEGEKGEKGVQDP